MSFFRQRSQPQQAAQLPTYTGLQLPTATSTLPVPIIYGRTKTSVNVMFYAGFTAVPELQRENRGGKGGIIGGGGGGGYQIVGWFYLADLLMGICEGPIDGIGNVFKGQSVFPFSQMGVSLFVGSDAQTPFSYITTKYPGHSLAYKKTAYLGCPQYNLGSSAALGSLNLEVKGLLYGTGFNGEDADPGEMIVDFLTNEDHGTFFPADELQEDDLVGASGDSSVQTYCWAMGLALSPNLNQFEPGNSTLTRWLRAINTASFVSQGMLRFVPYGDENVTGHGCTWIAPIEPVADINEDDFVILSSDQDPVEISRVDPLTLPSVWRAEVLDRGEDLDVNQYQPILVEARDMSATIGYGQRTGSTESFHEICEVEMGAMVVQTLLQRERYTKTIYKWLLDWSWIELDPMDVVTLTCEKLGLYQKKVRIIDIDEDEDGIYTLTAFEFIPGVATPGPNPSAGTIPLAVNNAVAAQPVNAVLIYEPPQGYTNAFNGGIPQIWFGASGGVGAVFDPNWGGANVWASVDGGVSYEQIGKISAPLMQGSLTANLVSSTGFDTTHTLAVDLTESAGVLDTITDDAAAAGGNLALLGSELVTFATATLSGTYQYNITRINRGFYGTTPSAHSTGSGFAQLGNAMKMDLPQNFIGTTMKFKFQSFNRYGGGIQDISTCVPYDYTPTGVGQGGAQVISVSQTLTLVGGSTSITSSIQIPANAILLAVLAENVTTIVGNVDLTGYKIDPVYESNGAVNTPHSEFGTGTLVSAAVVNTPIASRQWQVASAVILTADGSPSPQFTSGQIKLTLRYMTV